MISNENVPIPVKVGDRIIVGDRLFILTDFVEIHGEPAVVIFKTPEDLLEEKRTDG